MNRIIFYCVALFFFLGLASCNQSERSDETIKVACAASTYYAVKEIVALFESKSDIKVDLIFASSGKLTTQILEGAPYDIFISADAHYPEMLYRKGMSESAPKIYGKGKLVLWSTTGIVPTLNVLKKNEIKTIAIANPRLAPYGLASIDVLKSQGLFDVLSEKIVYGESISQTNHFITSQAAEIGFTALSTVLSPQLKDVGLWSEIDSSLYRKVEQSAVLLKHGTAKEA